MVWGGFPNPPGCVKEGTSGLGNPLHGFSGVFHPIDVTSGTLKSQRRSSKTSVCVCVCVCVWGGKAS